ncbi:MAG TPA: DNA gyrase inhibitor YacG [Rhizomicrobium sp.]|nr:DNA gyrase inhibitor YacG [Rhizomicrobium sp.]
MSEPQPETRKCAICGKPQDPKIRPFCSKRCANVDLNRWLKGGYAIPAEEGPEGPDEANGPADEG